MNLSIPLTIALMKQQSIQPNNAKTALENTSSSSTVLILQYKDNVAS